MTVRKRVPATTTLLKLEDLQQNTVYSRKLAASELPIGQYSHREGSELVFRDGPLYVAKHPRPNDDRIRVAKWDYASNKLTQYTVHIADLFDLKTDGYYPKTVVPIAQSK